MVRVLIEVMLHGKVRKPAPWVKEQAIEGLRVAKQILEETFHA